MRMSEERTAKNTLSWNCTWISAVNVLVSETSGSPVSGWVILSRSFVERFYILNLLFQVTKHTSAVSAYMSDFSTRVASFVNFESAEFLFH